jgi:hypothetical protein
MLIVGDSKKDAARLTGKALDNVTVVAPKPADYSAAYAQTPWLDVEIEAAHVWGCTGTILGRAARFDEISKALDT